MTIRAITTKLKADGGALLQFLGSANKGVLWSVISGGGSVQQLTDRTDAAGVAYARYDPKGGTPAVAGVSVVIRVISVV